MKVVFFLILLLQENHQRSPVFATMGDALLVLFLFCYKGVCMADSIFVFVFAYSFLLLYFCSFSIRFLNTTSGHIYKRKLQF